jgi:hypothetical protein
MSSSRTIRTKFPSQKVLDFRFRIDIQCKDTVENTINNIDFDNSNISTCNISNNSNNRNNRNNSTIVSAYTCVFGTIEDDTATQTQTLSQS